MDFMEKVGSVISEKGKEAVDKTRILAEIVSLKSQLATCEEVIRKNYSELGKLYYEENGNKPDSPYEKQLNAITNAKKGAEDIQEKINVLKSL